MMTTTMPMSPSPAHVAAPRIWSPRTSCRLLCHKFDDDLDMCSHGLMECLLAGSGWSNRQSVETTTWRMLQPYLTTSSVAPCVVSIHPHTSCSDRYISTINYITTTNNILIVVDYQRQLQLVLSPTALTKESFSFLDYFSRTLSIQWDSNSSLVCRSEIDLPLG